jgi:hypothetical protein
VIYVVNTRSHHVEVELLVSQKITDVTWSHARTVAYPDSNSNPNPISNSYPKTGSTTNTNA